MSNIEKLSSSSSLKDLVDRQELLTNNIEEQKNTLKEILISKNVEVADSENKLSILIQKVNELEENRTLWLYRNGNENSTSFTKSYITGQNSFVNKDISKLQDKIIGSVLKSDLIDPSKGSVQCCAETKLINLKEYSKLKAKIKIDNKPIPGYTEALMCVKSDNNDVLFNSNICSINLDGVNILQEYTLDISNINTEAYIVIGVYLNYLSSASHNINFEIHEVWLEK